jgi:hypothetical protein
LVGYTTRIDPQIAASELAEYMEATHPRQNAILVSARHRPTVKVRSYAKARSFLASELIGAGNDAEKIKARAAALQNGPAKDKGEVQENQMNADMLERYAHNLPQIQIPGGKFVAPPERTWHWNIKGLKVAITPHFISEDVDRKGGAIRGAAVFEYTKGKPYNSEVAKWFGTLLCMYAENVPLGGSPIARLSGCLDVQSGRFYSAPDKRARLITRLEAAAVAVVQRWPAIPKPPGA